MDTSTENSDQGPQVDLFGKDLTGELRKRSCINCSRRKVRCSRRFPCNNCTKANEECVFPNDKRAPRKLQRLPVPQLLLRLQQLEEEVQSLRSARGQSSEGQDTVDLGSSNGDQRESQGRSVDMENAKSPPKIREGNDQFQATDVESGRLIANGGQVRYVDDQAIVRIGNEIREMRDVINNSSVEAESSMSSKGDLVRWGYYIGYQPLPSTLRDYHPSAGDILKLWTLYCENVAPLISILHIPSVEQTIRTASNNPSTLDESSEALVFSVYFAAVTSMNSQQLASFGWEYDTAIKHYRSAVEHALARAGLVDSQDITTLQAAVLFLLCIFGTDKTKFGWAMSAFVIRIAQGQGLHQDGEKFGLTPFNTEIRRRLWWYICILDMVASQDHGTAPQIHPASYNTHFPSNIDSSNLLPDMQQLLEQTNYTDITLCILHCEMMTTLHQLKPTEEDSSTSSDARVKLLENLSKHLEDKYFRHFDLNVPIQWLSATISRLVLARAWLVVHFPTSIHKPGQLNREMTDKLFHTAVEIAEFSYLLLTNETTAQWSWLCRTYKQWQVMIFILSQLLIRPRSMENDRAWVVVKGLYNEWSQEPNNEKLMYWQLLTRLMEKVSVARDQDIRSSASLSDLESNPIQSFSSEANALDQDAESSIHESTDLEASRDRVSSHDQTNMTVSSSLVESLNSVLDIPLQDLPFDFFYGFDWL